MNLGRLFALIFAALFLIVTVAWLASVPHAARGFSVIEEWNRGIGSLGITPVFPPRQDIQVGDLFLVVGPAGADARPEGHKLYWLADLGLGSAIKDFYQNRFAMPVETGDKEPSGRLSAPAEAAKGAADGVFQTGPATRLRSVSFPSFSVDASRSAKLSVADTVLQFFRLGSFAQQDYRVSVSIPDAEGYGIPALTAFDAVLGHCIPAEKLDKLLEIYTNYAPGAPRSLEVVTGVYYARSIDYTVTLASGFGGTAAVTPADLEKTKNMVAELAQQSVPASGAKSEVSAAEPGAARVPTTPAKPENAADRGRTQGLATAIAADLDRMSAAIAGPNAPAVSGAVISSDARSVTLRQTFAQPVVIGYQSLPYPDKKHPCQKPPAPRTDVFPPFPPAPPVSRGQTFLVYFDWDGYRITPEGMKIAAVAALFYRATRSPQVGVVGYADLSGAADYNRRLSQRRADAVAIVLAGLGVPPSDMAVAGRGSADPRVPTPLGVREPENRRVEITIL